MIVKSLVCSAVLTAALGLADSAVAQDGVTLFTENCAACHQPTGKGVPGFFPALDGNKVVQGDPKAPAYVLLHGRGGMPNFSEELTDEKMASVLSYVRSAWGNKAPAVDTATIAAARGDPGPPQQDASVLPFH